ncbi:sugar phosphate isomerase/epimerase family protein [Paenibacillus herberti]|uniref:Xylose isomerase n=1 Tax=Paenibacillus herberti TaxID=1619309 RepID=A0A229P3F3_9BACL|nr:sugar phosphate isomerase/epimerase family protein [Paenibacillus herberti]OXM16581.1 xylose isomerase [Paenibacillus herberti]
MAIKNPIGVIVDSFQVGVREGLRKAKEVGADGVQIYAVSGEMDPDRLDAANRRELREYIDSLGLTISALVGDLAGHGFQDKKENVWKVEKSKRILDLALDLGCNIVTTHIGIVPDDENSEIYQTMLQACDEISRYASSKNAYFAIETGPERATHLKEFLDKLSTNGLSVNFDPANMVMVTGDDPVQGVYTLGSYIVHTHAKDGIKLKENVDPRKVYGMLGFEHEAMSHEKLAVEAEEGDDFREVPLGEGKVDWPNYLKALQDIGYTGYLTIEREVGAQPEQDIAAAVQFLRGFRA